MAVIPDFGKTTLTDFATRHIAYGTTMRTRSGTLRALRRIDVFGPFRVARDCHIRASYDLTVTLVEIVCQLSAQAALDRRPK